jgi:hypothetical protein
VLANVCQRPAGRKLQIKLAGIGQRWLEVERVMGIEPTLAAWEAAVLPLNYTRDATKIPITGVRKFSKMPRLLATTYHDTGSLPRIEQ